MKCGHCKGSHGTVAEVRNCSQFSLNPPKPKITPVTEPGMYRIPVGVYQVTLSKNNRLYARKLVTVMQGGEVHKLEFEYEKGAIFKLAAEDRMTVEQVGELGKITGHCWVCQRKLTVQKSIAAGIGPVCARKV